MNVFKFGGCEWMLGKCEPASLDLAKRIGLDGIQLGMGTGADGVDLRKSEVRQAYLDAVKRTGLAISSASAAGGSTSARFATPSTASSIADGSTSRPRSPAARPRTMRPITVTFAVFFQNGPRDNEVVLSRGRPPLEKKKGAPLRSPLNFRHE
jgi:hypothetical protein